MNNLLNGTSWGELPEEEIDLQVPEFMLSDYRTFSLAVPCSAYSARAAGRVKRQIRAEKKHRRDFKNGIAYIAILFGLMAAANLFVELICG